MRIAEMLTRGRPTVSFEFMAPRDEDEVAAVEKTVAALAGHAPGGAPPGPGQAFVPADPQFQHGSDLVAFLRRSGYRFGIGAACSAEKHPESPDRRHEFRYKQLKVDSGADFLITQLFFDNR